jgi:hypothetical protein
VAAAGPTMLRHHRLALIAILALATSLAAGCGGGGGSKTIVKTEPAAGVSVHSPSKAQFITQMDAICSKFHSKLDPLKQQLNALNSEQPSRERDHKIASILGQASQIDADAFSELQQVKPPTGDEAIIQKYLDSGAQVIQFLGDASTAADQSDVGQFTTLMGQERAADNTGKGLAQGYGFKVCGSG